VNTDLELALRLADLADAETLVRWSSHGSTTRLKSDGTPVTEADLAAERSVLASVSAERPGDGFIGEEVGERVGSTGRRWIVDGIDSTRSFAAGLRTWGTLIALESDGEIVLGLASSPAQSRRWWATRGGGAFVGSAGGSVAKPVRVSSSRPLTPDLVVTLPVVAELATPYREAVTRLAGGSPVDRPWCHQMRIAEGEIDVCVWGAGDIWDHAAPSIIVAEAGGRFSDFQGGSRLDTRTAVYSNGSIHDRVLAALAGSC